MGDDGRTDVSQYVPRSNIMHRDQPPVAESMLQEVIDYTQEVAEFLRIPWDAKGRRNFREWAEGYPTGWGTHFTASNAAVSKKLPLGRIPVLFRRFARRSGSPGVQFITWDSYVPQFEHIRKKYKALKLLGTDVWCWGLDKAFYHGNDLNDFAIGIEHRNIGKIQKRRNGSYGWGRDAKIDYVGRKPTYLRRFICEPFTRGQIQSSIVLGRWTKDLYPLEPSRFLGHMHVTSNRTDPFPHFPLQLVRDSVFFDDLPISDLDWLMAYNEDSDFLGRNDEYIEEWLLDEGDSQGHGEEQQRHFDRGLDSDADLMDVWSRVGGKGELEEERDPLYGQDGVVNAGDVVEAKKALVHLGYWPFAWRASFTAGTTPEFVLALKMFQDRWVKKKGKRVVQLVKDTGEIDEPTAERLNQMLKQFDLLPTRRAA